MVSAPVPFKRGDRKFLGQLRRGNGIMAPVKGGTYSKGGADIMKGDLNNFILNFNLFNGKMYLV